MNLLKKNTLTLFVLFFTVVLSGCNKDDDMLTVVASFEQTVDENTGVVTFENTSQNATSYLWDFGDGGTTSTEENPVRSFGAGSYTVSLTATGADGDTDVFETTLDLTGIKQLAANGNFEAGDGTEGWIFFNNGGTAAVDNTLSNGGGMNSAKIATNGPSNPGIKQHLTKLSLILVRQKQLGRRQIY